MTTTSHIIRTRSTAPFALVKVHREKPVLNERGTLSPGAVLDVELVGYAHSTGERVTARARRLGARIVPIEAGRVFVVVDR